MNFPIKGDIKFIKNLKPGTSLYIVESGWDADKNNFSVTVKSMVFDGYKENAIQSDDTIMANLHVGKIKVEHNICYGFFETPMLALKAFKAFVISMTKATDKAINRENNRLEYMVNEAVDKMKKANDTGAKND